MSTVTDAFGPLGVPILVTAVCAAITSLLTAYGVLFGFARRVTRVRRAVASGYCLECGTRAAERFGALRCVDPMCSRFWLEPESVVVGRES